ncbi:toll/interleukin-1 receptor domain-containing protein [archaeon]|nr:toll/interleukin-1 receptor domain-containing protein [Nanoarchaeota archaeon]MBU4300848.1 toll/interleukin-1 receptor domain-containing protein [Nanoarchaeota archaeon]MCG2724480.1 toll/interleukin-1 receptor domain-containing protein [archaeon]
MEHETKPLKIFLSHADRDKLLASKIKAGLGTYGLNVFLAHEDINPTSDWSAVLIDELEMCDIFIALLTPNYKEADYPDQEAGIAYYMTTKYNKVILSLSTERTPHGFLCKFQSLKIDEFLLDIGKGKPFHFCKAVLTALYENKLCKERIKTSLIDTFCNSHSFEQSSRTIYMVYRLLHPKLLTSEEADRLVDAALINCQIYGAAGVIERLKTVVEKHYAEPSKKIKLNQLSNLM